MLCSLAIRQNALCSQTTDAAVDDVLVLILTLFDCYFKKVNGLD